ncbi:MAG: type II secretion system protein GspD [Planctomycetes bacterium]|nr:type II secretion system protein GspD [Planctomycetota bacterium]
MNKQNRLSRVFWLVLALVFCLPISPASSQRSNSDTTLESVGKENPFEVVRPIIDAKKALIAKMVRPSNDTLEQQPVVEIIPDRNMQMVMLKFLQADSVEPVATNLLSEYGMISIDSATNSIIVCDTPEKLQMIIAEINKIDKTPQQVMIEVVIVDVKLEDETEIGVDWAHPGGKGNIFTQTLAGAASGMDFTFLHNGIDISVKALQQVRDVKILASPRIMVLSGESALIQTVEEIPYTELIDSTEGGSGLTTTEFKEVGVTLDVSVLVTDEQRIKLTVSPQQSVDTGRTGVDSNNTTPIIDIRRAMTTLLMDDGQVAVLGGLRRRNLKNSIDKIPLLGDLPLVGFLFSNDKIEIEHTELVVFLSPHIHKGEPLTEREMEQFNELRNSPAPEFQEHKRPEFEFLKDVFGVINETANIYP